MKEFAQKVIDFEVPEGKVGIIYMGQAGFILKDGKGRLIAYDLYLSNCCEREFGFKRITAMLLDPEDIAFDAIFCSHAHFDHLDPDSIEGMLANGKSRVYTPQDGMELLEQMGIKGGIKIAKNQSIDLFGGEVKASFVFCDHGAEAPYAVGTVFEIEGKRIYFAGDTCYRPEKLVNPKTVGCDFVSFPINGAYGNLNEEEGAMLAEKLGADLSVPSHFWTFAEHGGDPAKFMEAAKKRDVNFMLMMQGEMITI